MTPGPTRLFRYKWATPSGIKVDMRPDQTPPSMSRSVGTGWPHHGGGRAAWQARGLSDRPAPVKAVNRQEICLLQPANFRGSAAR